MSILLFVVLDSSLLVSLAPLVIMVYLLLPITEMELYLEEPPWVLLPLSFLVTQLLRIPVLVIPQRSQQSPRHLLLRKRLLLRLPR